MCDGVDGPAKFDVAFFSIRRPVFVWRVGRISYPTFLALKAMTDGRGVACLQRGGFLMI